MKYTPLSNPKRITIIAVVLTYLVTAYVADQLPMKIACVVIATVFALPIIIDIVKRKEI